MAIVSKTFRCGPTLQYDDSDWFESRVEELGHINPSLEFWLKENASNFSTAIVIGAGFGLSSKQLIDAGVEVTSLEPTNSRFALLETNIPDGNNINKAAGSLSGQQILYCNENNKSAARVGKEIGLQTQIVDVITIDSLNIDPDLILIYANGNELDILDGATNTLASNPNCKIILKWVPDLIWGDIDDALNKLQSFNKSIKIIHWEEDDSISYKEQLTGVLPNDNLKAVISADLLLE